MDPDHYRLLRQPNFDDLVKLMQLYGDPALDDEMANAFFSYRDMRNAAEHHGTIPSFSALAGALADVRDTILHLLDLDETQLPPIDRLAEIGIDDKIDLNESPSVLETHRIRDSSEVEFLQFEELHEKSFPDPTIRDWS